MSNRWIIFSLCCILYQHALATVGASQSRAASITLKAKWAGTSTLLEAVQFLVSKCLWFTISLHQKPTGCNHSQFLLYQLQLHSLGPCPPLQYWHNVCISLIKRHGEGADPIFLAFGRQRRKETRCGDSLTDGTRKRVKEKADVGTRLRMLQPPSSHLR